MRSCKCDRKTKKAAEQLGSLYAKSLFEDDNMRKLHGSGGFKSFMRGFKKYIPLAAGVVATTVAPELAIPAEIGAAVLSGDGKNRRKRVLSNKMKERNQLVKRIMKEKNMSLPAASRFIKENRLIIGDGKYSKDKSRRKNSWIKVRDDPDWSKIQKEEFSDDDWEKVELSDDPDWVDGKAEFEKIKKERQQYWKQKEENLKRKKKKEEKLLNNK